VQRRMTNLLNNAVSHGVRDQVLPAILAVVSAGSCWLREWHLHTLSQIDFCFEMHLRSAIEMYGALMETGLEMTPESHADLTALCTLRRHSRCTRDTVGQVVSVRLDVSFLPETEWS
jgi:hypothetical protein